MRILGIDPGLRRLGYGVIEDHRLLAYGVLETSSSEDVPTRLREIYRGIQKILTEYKPDCLASERLLFSANRKTAFDVARALGVALLAAGEAGIPWYEYTPTDVKLAITGSGKSDKAQVEYMVAQLLQLDREKEKSLSPFGDAADALAVALCHLHQHRLRRLETPSSHSRHPEK
jgi:crossover junction endodeoxyribonuclease RuvC